MKHKKKHAKQFTPENSRSLLELIKARANCRMHVYSDSRKPCQFLKSLTDRGCKEHSATHCAATHCTTQSGIQAARSMTESKKHRSLASQQGFSLIEVMIAALVISIGMLGIAGLQLVGLKGSYQSYMRHQATFIVSNLVERMRANPSAVLVQNYVFDTDNTGTIDCSAAVTACNLAGSNCTSQQLANYDKFSVACGLGASNNEGIKSLTNGRIQVSCQNDVVTGINDCSDGNVTLEVSWTERQYADEAPDSLATDAARTDNIILNTRISP